MSTIKSKLISVLALFFILSVNSFSDQVNMLYPEPEKPTLRVKLFSTPNEILAKPSQSFAIKCIFSGKQEAVYYASTEMVIVKSPDGIILGENNGGILEKGLKKVIFIPKVDSYWLYVNGNGYRGALEIISDNENDSLEGQARAEPSLLLLNLVFVEDYLKGVVPAEMGLSKENKNPKEWEALKAQIVAGRSYALFQMEKKVDSLYHLESSVLDQIYNGMKMEDSLVNQLIEKTKGEVVQSNKKIIKAYYHSTCGGKTENVEEIWDKPEEDYLKRVSDDLYCSWSKRYKWEEVWNKEDLESRLPSFLKSFFQIPDEGIGKLLDIKIVKRSSSGRVKELKIETENKTFLVFKDNIRWVLRRAQDPSSILFSTLFDLETKKDKNGEIKSIIIKGKGNGHGVGMCQTGAIGMARKGYSYQQILTHYYTGVKIVKTY
jgi:stage II sporulation protein D